MKKPNFRWFVLRFEIYQKIPKTINFQNSLEKPHRVSWRCKTVDSKGFSSLLNCKMEKRAVEVKYGGFGAHMGPYEPPNRHIFLNHERIWWVENGETPFFSFLQLSNGETPFEYAVLQRHGTWGGFSKEFWKLGIFEIFW